MLPLVPTFHAGESLMSFLSRVAAAHHSRRALEFCNLVGLDWRGLNCGSPAAIAKLAKLSGIDATVLAGGAIRVEGSGHAVGQEEILKSTLRRGRIHVCPTCIKDDIATSSLRPIVATWNRLAWMMEPIRTCHIHDRALVEVTANRVRELRGDFARLIEPHLRRLDALFDSSRPRPASNLERYLVGRLVGDEHAQAWLGGLSWHAAAITCEMLGAVKLHGRDVNALKLSGNDWWAAGEAGFKIAQDGPDALQDFFNDMHREYGTRGRGKEEGQAILGRFYNWLNLGAGGANACFEPVRRVVFDWISGTMPVGAGETILGFTVERRRWHSIWTAANEFRIHPKRVKKLFAANGLIGNADEGKLNHHVLVTPEAAAALLRPAAETIPLVQVETYLGAGRVHTDLLAKAGFIVSMPGRGTAGLRRHMFRKSELDSFLARLLAGAVECADIPEGAGDIPTVAKITGCRAMDIVKLALDGGIWKRRLTTATGYLSLLLRVDDVNAKLREAEHGGLTALEASKRLRTRENVVVALIDLGAIKAEMLPRPEDGRMMRYILPSHIAAFEAEFVALTELIRETGRSGDALKAAFTAADITPAFSREQTGAAWYRRVDIKAQNDM